MKLFHLLPLAGLLWICGCATYVTPGQRADLAALTAPNLKAAFAAEPTARFPASIAVARIQASDYSNYNLERHGGKYGRGRYTYITTREVETQVQLDRISTLPKIDGLIGLSTLLMPEDLRSESDLRTAAARLKADMLLIYTFQTSFYTDDPAKTLTVLTLGLSPNQKVKVTVTASAILVDVRTGFVYGALEASEKRDRLTNAWQNRDSADAARRDAEKAAFEKLAGEFDGFWAKVVARYDKKA